MCEEVSSIIHFRTGTSSKAHSGTGEVITTGEENGNLQQSIYDLLNVEKPSNANGNAKVVVNKKETAEKSRNVHRIIANATNANKESNITDEKSTFFNFNIDFTLGFGQGQAQSSNAGFEGNVPVGNVIGERIKSAEHEISPVHIINWEERRKGIFADFTPLDSSNVRIVRSNKHKNVMPTHKKEPDSAFNPKETASASDQTNLYSDRDSINVTEDSDLEEGGEEGEEDDDDTAGSDPIADKAYDYQEWEIFRYKVLKAFTQANRVKTVIKHIVEDTTAELNLSSDPLASHFESIKSKKNPIALPSTAVGATNSSHNDPKTNSIGQENSPKEPELSSFSHILNSLTGMKASSSSKLKE
jgi:hypothetical protein